MDQRETKDLEQDQALLGRLRDPGHVSMAFRELVTAYQVPIYRIIRRMVVNHEDADDLTQDTFVKAWKYLGTFKGDSSLFTWLYRIAVREALSFLKRKKRLRWLTLGDYTDHLANMVDKTGQLNGDFVMAKFQKALLTLPDKQRLVFNMRYFEGLSYQEMGGILATSEGALKASYHWAVKKMEASLLADPTVGDILPSLAHDGQCEQNSLKKDQ